MSAIFNLFRATNQDHARLTELCLCLYQYHHANQPQLVKLPQRDEIEDELTNYLNNPECFVFIAKCKDQTVGFVSGQLYQIISPLSKPDSLGSIDHWYVANEWRGMGIGGALLTKIEREFNDYGVDRLTVEVWDFNESALKTYQKRGFKAHLHCLTKATV
jgi:ribosomal protein S18 acetylase RimI-like enzyme